MDVLSQLVRAQLENKSSDYSAATAKGLIWHNTSSGLTKVDDGTNVKVLRYTTDVIPETVGGTNQTTYTQGDILYASASNTLSKLAKGSNGQFLQQGATIPAWAAVAATLGVKTKVFGDSPYTILAGDDVILVDTSGGAVTLTLPASTAGGKVYRVKKTTADLNAVTTARAGSDTIAEMGNASSTLLHTYGEEIMIIDATSGVWQVMDRKIPSSWESYSPTLGAGFGTTSGVSVYWRRIGNSIDIKGSFISGTLAASSASITLPTGLTIGTITTDQRSVSGVFTSMASGSQEGIISNNRVGLLTTSLGTSTSTLYFAVAGTAGTINMNNGNALNATTGDSFAFQVNGLSISGWNG